MQMNSYNLESYANIIFSGVNYVIPDVIKQNIQRLVNELGSIPETNNLSINTNHNHNHNNNENDINYKRSSFNGSPRRSKTNNNNNNNNNRRPQEEAESWEKQKIFKSTIIDKKEGFDKIVNDICVCLNKISNKNYDTQRDSIFKLIDQVKESEDETSLQTNLKKISNAIFNIASANKFYSEIYATLYKELISKFPVFNDIVDGCLQQYMENIDSITYVDQNVDYDKYCDNNKLNDKRKAMAAFIVNLMSREVIEKTKVLDIIIQLENLVMKYIIEPNHTYEVDEITENINIFITTSIQLLKCPHSGSVTTPEAPLRDLDLERGYVQWTTVVETIKKYSTYKSNDYKSLSSRAVFKYMDIYGFITKNESK